MTQVRSSHRGCSIKKVFSKISKNHLKTPVPESLFSFNFIKKETLVQVFPCEFCELLRTSFWQKTSRVIVYDKKKFSAYDQERILRFLLVMDLVYENFYRGVREDNCGALNNVLNNATLIRFYSFRSSRSQMFLIDVLKNFGNFTRKHLYWSLF